MSVARTTLPAKVSRILPAWLNSKFIESFRLFEDSIELVFVCDPEKTCATSFDVSLRTLCPWWVGDKEEWDRTLEHVAGSHTDELACWSYCSFWMDILLGDTVSDVELRPNGLLCIQTEGTQQIFIPAMRSPRWVDGWIMKPLPIMHDPGFIRADSDGGLLAELTEFPEGIDFADQSTLPEST